ncbi:hypothetical protein CHCC14566_5167 [Bacillus licheniformis]|nr:hypothetical protein CHCC14566_5167 [Bacillus licheniformis]
MIDLRIVKAATEEQEIYIEELVSELYQIFPLYLNKQKIKELKKQGALQLKEDESKERSMKRFRL